MEKILYEIVIAPVVKIVSNLITKQVGYATCSTRHVTNMANKKQELEKRRDDVKKHVDDNNIKRYEIPKRARGWLKEVEETIDELKKIPTDEIQCLKIRMRYRAGKNACKYTEKIQKFLTEEKQFKWKDTPKATGRVDSEPASPTASTPPPSLASGGDGFQSREKQFEEALKLLQQDQNKSQVIALCGMGGVGKTTLMKRLAEVAKDQKMFGYIVKVVFGKTPNMHNIQNDIAADIIGGEGLHKDTLKGRADSLCESIKKVLEVKKILLILDDLWENIELGDIGLTSPLPNGLTLMLISRDLGICKQIAHRAQSVPKEIILKVLEETEAQNLFFQITKVSKGDELYHIGCEIVKKCGGLPLAIQLISSTLINEAIGKWRDTLDRLNHSVLDDKVQDIIMASYDYIKREEDKKIFLYCGLFPEDSNIPIEDLTRHAWGLNLFENVSTLGKARDRANTCVRNLINANLLIASDYPGCVKMHDLVLDFVLGYVSKHESAWIINHRDISKWGSDEICKSCEKLSITCTGRTEIPKEFKYPNLSVLQLMHGDLTLKFPKDFYESMENLKVIAGFNMQYLLLPRSLQCSTRLKSLCLHECGLMFDYSFVGNLVNLEVLSFAHCGIRKLPSAIGNLVNLKLLDLTGCVDLSVDDGVFKKLGKLEELYMRVFEKDKIRFTDSNWEELKMLSRQLAALEIEFVEKTQLNILSFEKLVKFKIAMGCKLKEKNENGKYSFTNTLKLVTDRNSLLDSKITELFKNTENLYLKVKGLICLKDVLAEPYDQCSFRNLKDLEVKKCPNLEYLFPISVVSDLKQLEHLKISSCSDLEALVCDDESEINGVGEMITFEKLKFLSLENLPKLERLFPVEYVVQLPQLVELNVFWLDNFTSIYSEKHNNSALFNNQFKMAKLEKLKISNMEKLNQIWGCEIGGSSEEEVNNISMLRFIEVERCKSLVNLFPTNPMRLLNHLESLTVISCGSLEVIFNIDLDCVGHEVEQLSSLNNIVVEDLEKLREVWKIKGGENNYSGNSNILIRGFGAVERISIKDCKTFRNILTPVSTNTHFDMSALVDISISYAGRNEYVNDTTVAFPSNLTFHYLRTLYMDSYEGVEVVFEIECPTTTTSKELVTATYNQQSRLPNLQELKLESMTSMSHVWKCSNWNKLLILQDQSSFHNLTIIYMRYCNRIKYLFSPLMAKHFSNLKEIEIERCAGMEEIISNRDDNDEEMSMAGITLFPQLHSLSFSSLPNFTRIDGGGVKGITSVINDQFKLSPVRDVVSWSLCQYSREIYISYCDRLSTVIPFHAIGQMQKLQELTVLRCESLMEVFETQRFDNSGDGGNSTNMDEGSDGTAVIPRQKNMNEPLLSNLKRLAISYCNRLQHVLTFSTLKSLKKLEELTIEDCNAMKVIVKKEDEEQIKDVIFPCLKSLELQDLPNLEGFFLGINVFKWPSLETVTIRRCRRIMVFTSGQSEALALKFIHTSLGQHSPGCGLNFHLRADQAGSESRSLWSTRFERLRWPFHNLIKLHMDYNYFDVKSVIPSIELQNLKILESIEVCGCSKVEEVFESEALEGTTSDSQAVVEIQNLKEMELKDLDMLKYIWKGNHHGTVLKLPNLTTMTINLCNRLKYVFTSSMVGSLVQLKYLHVSSCAGMEVIVKEEEAEELEVSKDVVAMKGKISSFAVVEIPNLRQVELRKLQSLKYIWKSNDDGRTLLKFPNLTTLSIQWCNSLDHVFTSSMVGSLLNLQELHVDSCGKMEVIVNVEKEEPKVFEVVAILEGTKSESINVVEIPNLRQVELRELSNLKYIWKSNDNGRTILKFPNLTTLSIHWCGSLKHVFTSSMVDGLQQLQHLNICYCRELEVIVNVEEDESECDAKVKDIVLPCLKSLKLEYLESLKGFCLGKDNYSWPSLDTLEIKECPEITVFTNGHLNTPSLQVIDTDSGRFYLEEDLNSFIKIKKQEGFSFSRDY